MRRVSPSLQLDVPGGRNQDDKNVPCETDDACSINEAWLGI